MEVNNKLVSIIVPVYNNAKYIHKCLDSLLDQSYENIEIIVINDGSTDRCKEIIDEYLILNRKIKVINQVNQGVSKARNNGIKVAQGKYLMFCDSDDFVSKEFVASMVRMYDETNSDIGCCCIETFSDVTLIMKSKETYKETIFVQNELYTNVLWNQKCSGYVCNKIFKREIVVENNLTFDSHIQMWEDLLFVIQYLNYCSIMSYTTEKLYFYRNNINGATNQKYNEKTLSMLWANEKIYNICLEKIDDEKLMNRVANDLMNICCYSFVNVIKYNLKNKYTYLKRTGKIYKRVTENHQRKMKSLLLGILSFVIVVFNKLNRI